MRQGREVVAGSLFIILVTCQSKNVTNAVKTDTIRNVVGSSYPVPSDHLNLINKKFDKNSQTKLINRKKRNSPKMKHVKETLPRILNKNSDIFASDHMVHIILNII